MNIITTLITNWRNKRRMQRFKAAVMVVESAGFTVCDIRTKGNADYIVDADRVWHRIGRRNG